jgi:hypothetical protein
MSPTISQGTMALSMIPTVAPPSNSSESNLSKSPTFTTLAPSTSNPSLSELDPQIASGRKSLIQNSGIAITAFYIAPGLILFSSGIYLNHLNRRNHLKRGSVIKKYEESIQTDSCCVRGFHKFKKGFRFTLRYLIPALVFLDSISDIQFASTHKFTFNVAIWACQEILHF